MYLTSGIKSECCGCGGCSQVCPRKCIKIVPDDDGFLFPVKDSLRCIHCHMCEKICPIENITLNDEARCKPLLVAARCKDEASVMEASSGGAFGAIVKSLRKNDEWMVWGASFDDNLQLSHHCSKDNNDFAPLHKSKYIQSNLGNAFIEIKQQLKEEKNVIFSGTPCQVAALHNYLKGVKTDRLVCIDLICHGVPNQKMFDAYCEEESKYYKSKVKSVRFRFKTCNKLNNHWNSRNMLLITEDGKRHIQNRYNSRFLRAYCSYLFSRESCYSCIFAKPIRQGDLTLADFWGIQRFYTELSADKGVSLIQANTEKGHKILKRLDERMDIYEIDRNKYLNMTNGAMVTRTPKNHKKEDFFKYIKTHSFNESIDRYVPKYKEIIKIEIAMKMSPETRKRIKCLLRK